MRSILAFAMVVLGCGRINFGSASDAGSDGADGAIEVPDAPVDADTTVFATFGRAMSTFPGTTRDTFISESLPNFNHGATIELAVDAAPDAEHLLLRFDVSAIPATVTVTSAKVSLVVTNPSTDAMIEAYRVLEDWDEGASDAVTGFASWTDRFQAVSWAGAGATGASRATTAMGQLAPPFVDDNRVFMQLAPDVVQLWISDPATNFGMVLAQVGGADGPAFASREDGRDEYRPELTVFYVP
jgi:hypothetical protein